MACDRLAKTWEYEAFDYMSKSRICHLGLVFKNVMRVTIKISKISWIKHPRLSGFPSETRRSYLLKSIQKNSFTRRTKFEHFKRDIRLLTTKSRTAR